MVERRNHGRRDLPPINPTNLDGLSYVANISMGGAFIKTNQLREVGASMGITIKLPLKGSPPIKANCIVRWISEYGENSSWKGGMGVEFKEISSRSREWITRYVQTMEMRESKRKFRRNTTRVQMDYQHKDQWITGISANVSEGGLFINTTDVLPKGSILRLKLHFPFREEPIYAKGKVKWANAEVPTEMDKMVPQGMGIEFFSMKSGDREFIARHLEEKKERD